MLFSHFAEFCDDNDVEYIDSGRILKLQECPDCGSQGFKVWMYDDSPEEHSDIFWAKCHKCGTRFNSYTYLVEIGHDIDDVNSLHKHNFAIKTNEDGFSEIDLTAKEPKKKEEYVPNVYDVSGFFNIRDWMEHPAAKYAIKRGVRPEHYDIVRLDININAVVFICKENEQVVGYQSRLLRPWDPKMKSISVEGWSKTKHIMEFPADGDIAVVEGPFTGVSAWHYGYHGVCTFGAGVSYRQIEMIGEIASRLNKRVAVAYDLDTAGNNGYRKICNQMEKMGIEVYKIKPEHGNDLNDSWQAGKGVEIDNIEMDTSIPEVRLI